MLPNHDRALARIQDELNRIPADILAEFREKSRRHTYSAHLNAHHAQHEYLGYVSLGAPTCSKTDLLFLSGHNTTDPAGRKTISLASSLCEVLTEGIVGGENIRLVMTQQANFVATPCSSTPAMMTVLIRSDAGRLEDSHFLRDRQGNQDTSVVFLTDVFFDVMSWKVDGTPAGETEFSWLCTVEAKIKWAGG